MAPNLIQLLNIAVYQRIFYEKVNQVTQSRTIKRIGFDAKRIFNNRTGLGNYSRFIVNSLLNHYPQSELYLFTPSIGEEWQDLYRDVQRVNIITPQTVLGKSFKSAWRTFSLASEIEAFNLDVFHGLSNELPLGIDGFTGKKVVTIHDLIFLRYPDYYSNIDRFIYTRKFLNACMAADLVIATSEQTRADIISFLHIPPEKIKVIYQDCDPIFAARKSELERQKVKSNWQLPDQFILCVGTIEQRKNQLTVLKAFHQASPENMQLVFIGRKTKYANALDEYITENNLMHRVKFIERITWQDLPAVFQLASLFIYASEFEGFGIPVVEAYRSGVPAILARTSSLVELGNEHSAWFDPHDTATLSSTIHAILSNPSMANALIENGSLLQHRFDAPTLSKQLIEAYQA